MSAMLQSLVIVMVPFWAFALGVARGYRRARWELERHK